jgi:hypothetical protein
VTSVQDPETASGSVMWPQVFSGADLHERLRVLGIPIAITSPIATLLPAIAAPRSSAKPTSDIQDGLARALRILAAPRQLLLLSLDRTEGAAHEGEVLGFLNDGDQVVRFDIGARGCLVAAPCGHGRFARLVSSLAGIDGDDTGGEPILMSQQFVEAIVALRATGLFGQRDAHIARVDAETAIATVVDDETRASDLLHTLEVDGVLTVDESTVKPQAAWLDCYPFLSMRSRLRIDAIELADLAAGRTHRKRLAILGDKAERVVFLPPACDESGSHVGLELAPATLTSVARTIEQLLAPPLAPPSAPVTDCDGVRCDWNSAPRENRALPEWNMHALEELMAQRKEGAAVPDALLTPCAAIEIRAAGRDGANPERHVLAFAAAQAVEWTLDGSWVCWRALSPGNVAVRLDQLVHADDSPMPGVTTCELAASTVRALLTGAGAAGCLGETPVPVQLRTLASDQEMRCYTIHAAHRANGRCHRQVLLLAAGRSGGMWRFEPGRNGFIARAIGSSEIHAALAAALTPKPMPIPSANGAQRTQGRARR